MGIETLWFMPLTPISEKMKKGTLGSYYACSDYYTINHEFGTGEDFNKLVKLAHSMNMKVLVDWVANHTGWDHIWTKEHPDWYKRDPQTGQFKAAHGMDDIIELDFTDPALRNAMISAMKYWIDEYDIDGFRCDLAFWVQLDFWIEARTELEKTKHLFWLGELDPLDNPEYMGCFDAAYTWTWMHKAREFYHQHLPVSELELVLYMYESIGNKTMRAWFTANHDENTWNGTEYEKYGHMAKALAVFSCMWNGVPLIYSGQELPNHKRLKFFDKDHIEWSETCALHDFYKILLSFHTEHPALRAGDNDIKTLRLRTSNDDKVFGYVRKKEDREVLVLLNLSGVAVEQLKIEDGVVSGKFNELFTSTEIEIDSDTKFQLPPWGYFVFSK